MYARAVDSCRAMLLVSPKHFAWTAFNPTASSTIALSNDIVLYACRRLLTSARARADLYHDGPRTRLIIHRNVREADSGKSSTSLALSTVTLACCTAPRPW